VTGEANGLWAIAGGAPLVAGRYERLRCIGEGGSGVVYEVLDRLRNRRVALKTLSESTPLALYGFKQEFRALAELRHPNLVHLHEFVSPPGGSEFFTMELVSGTNFRHYTRNVQARMREPVTLAEAPTLRHAGLRELASPLGSVPSETQLLVATPAKLEPLRAALAQLVAGLRALHAAGKLHRDIKPSNVMVSTEGRVVILDFGLSTGVSHREVSENLVVGTPEYMAPEQILNEALAPASDWYAVGALLFDSLVGRPPFRGSMADVFQQKLTQDCPRPSELVSGVPDDLDELCSRLLSRDPGARPTGRELARALCASSGASATNSGYPSIVPTSLVGRHGELAVLESALQEASKGTPAAVLLHGPSGIGKSALLSHFLGRVAREGRAQVFASCVYEQESIPYKAVDGLLDLLSQHLDVANRDELPPAPCLQALGQLFPVLRRINAFAPDSSDGEADPLRTRERAYEGLRQVLGHVARAQPIVLAIDDAQWGDLDSVALLLDVVGKATSLPLLLVLSHRELGPTSSPFLEALSRRWPAAAPLIELPIGLLSEVDVRQLVARTLPATGGVHDDVVDRVFVLSAGNAFLAQELAFTLLPSAAHAARPVISVQGVPSSLDTMLLDDRLRGLDPAALRLLEMVAASGRALSAETGACAAGIESGLDGTISALSQRRLIRATHQGGLEQLEVSHDRIREWILARLPEAERRSHHRRLAETLEAIPQADADLWLEHWLRSGDSPQIRRVALAAAARAAERLAFKRAESLYRTALTHAGSQAADEVGICRALAQVLEWDGRGAEAAQSYLQAAARSSGFERSALESTAGMHLIYAGSFGPGAQLLRASLRELDLPAPASRLGALAWLVAGRLRLARLESKLARAPKTSASPAGQARVEVLHAATFGFILTDPLLGECMQVAHLAAALREGTPQQTARAVALEASQRAHRSLDGGRGSAERLFQRAELMAQSSPDKGFLEFVHACRGVSQFLCGDFRGAHDLLERAYGDVPRHRAGWHTTASIYNVLALSNLGRFECVAARLPALLAGAEARGDRFTASTLRVCAAVPLLLARGDSATARVELREGMAIWDQPSFLVQHWRAMWWSAETDLYDGLAGAARERCLQDEARLRNSFLLRVQYIRAMTLFLRARCALGTFDEAPAARANELRRVHKRLSSEGRAWTDALAAIVLAGLALRTDDNRAVERLKAAIELATRAELSAHAQSCRLVLGEHLGGAEGQELRREAEAELKRRGAHEPRRFAATLLPMPA
jgi:eukaryotic-like serine/threonine-protein kinase